MTSLKHPPSHLSLLSCLRRADPAGAQVGLRLRTCKKPRAGRVSRKQLPAERFFELASPHPRAAG